MLSTLFELLIAPIVAGVIISLFNYWLDKDEQ